MFDLIATLRNWQVGTLRPHHLGRRTMPRAMMQGSRFTFRTSC